MRLIVWRCNEDCSERDEEAICKESVQTKCGQTFEFWPHEKLLGVSYSKIFRGFSYMEMWYTLKSVRTVSPRMRYKTICIDGQRVYRIEASCCSCNNLPKYMNSKRIQSLSYLHCTCRARQDKYYSEYDKVYHNTTVAVSRRCSFAGFHALGAFILLFAYYIGLLITFNEV